MGLVFVGTEKIKQKRKKKAMSKLAKFLTFFQLGYNGMFHWVVETYGTQKNSEEVEEKTEQKTKNQNVRKDQSAAVPVL